MSILFGALNSMVWNITKDKIVECMTVSPEQAWAVLGPKRPASPVKGVPDPMSDAMKAGRWNVQDVGDEIIKKFKKTHNMR